MYGWWVFVHLVGVFGFLMSHGVSVAVLFRLRKERDPVKVATLKQLSGTSIQAFYVSLLVLLVGGIVAGFLGDWWSQGWIWAAIVVLVITSVAMTAIASPYYRRVDRIAQAMAGGSKAVTDEQFDQILRSGRPGVIAAIGIIGLAAILYLMVLKPTLGFSGSSMPSGSAAASCEPGGSSLNVSAEGLRFDTDCLAAPASRPITLTFDNRDGGVPHNVSIYRDASASSAVFTGETFIGVGSVTYRVNALPAGTYLFRCDVHPTQMTGTFLVR